MENNRVMDYSQVCQGWIYYIRNKINGKMYIGQTTHFRKRKRDHFKRESCTALKAAFNKYGVKNFEMEIILTFKAINKRVCRDILNYFETFYINKYNTYFVGYNSTKGGDGTFGKKHSTHTKKLIGEKNKEHKINKKTILQYTLEGNFIKEYPSILGAAKEYPNFKTVRNNIRAALKGGSKREACGYMWFYKEENLIPLKVDPYTNEKRLKVYYFSKNGELLGEYGSITEASIKSGIPKGTIKASIKERKNGKRKTIKNYWSHNKNGDA